MKQGWFLASGLGRFLLLFLSVTYGTGVGPGLVHLPVEFKVSEAREEHNDLDQTA